MDWLSRVGSAVDDARRRMETMENAAHDAVQRAKAEVTEGASSIRNTVRDRVASCPEPSPAVLEHAASAAVDFANNAAKNATAHTPIVPHLPRVPTLPKLPQVIPNVGEEGSTTEAARPYVMLAAGAGTSYVSGHLGPAGAVAQRGLDEAVNRYGTAQDKFNFGYGQMAGAVAVGVQGAAMATEGGSFEVASAGLATPIAVPVAAVGAMQIAVAISHADGAQALMTKGSAGTGPAAGVAPKPKDFRRGELEEHFGDHAGEWPKGMTREQYDRGAKELLSRPPGGDILGHTRPNGDIMRYNKAKNEIAVMSRDGTIRTYFRPSGGISYWNRQVQ